MLKKSVPAGGEDPIKDAGAFELGPPVLLEGADIAQYEGLLARVTLLLCRQTSLRSSGFATWSICVGSAAASSPQSEFAYSFFHRSGFAAVLNPLVDFGSSIHLLNLGTAATRAP